MRTRRGMDTQIGKKMTSSADQDYKFRMKIVRGLASDIDRALKNHENAQKEDSENYGRVGDLAHIADGLKEVLRSLTGV